MGRVLICQQCMTSGDGKRSGNPGLWGGFFVCLLGGFIFALLWLGCLVLPIVELATVRRRCRACESTQMIPVDTPAGRLLAEKAEQSPPTKEANAQVRQNTGADYGAIVIITMLIAVSLGAVYVYFSPR